METHCPEETLSQNPSKSLEAAMANFDIHLEMRMNQPSHNLWWPKEAIVEKGHDVSQGLLRNVAGLEGDDYR